ncbi:RagB/SusD family nutrient uptake outer membrane protein [Spirosoma montaniterrae]|uniref:Carbohydrate-binding protein SusD n=1 Tax=Spirosoma montaniterrae TaxID=1178516 RepID=A0A1P9WRS8_9BACT|nr:RagB/SusD family nutrient uptake outer membrane protein [Spirosoma montaniterrae]AQG78063.1 hypothetical protein AWR27_01070 [Spirosoma montaniterrae]
MRHITYCLIAGLLTLTACNDWLTEMPRSSKPIGGATRVDAQASVDGIYAFLRQPYDKGGYANMGFSILELPTGQYLSAAIDDFSAKEVADLVYTRNNGHFAGWWNSSYGGIQAANIAINTIPTITDAALTADLRSQLLGEARFLRAYYYFNLVRMFGDIPIVLTTTTSIADGQIGKSSVKDVYEKVIVPDLLFAEQQKLPLVSTSGRVANGAVKGLLAKVYLTMAGLPLQQKDKYALAKAKAKEVMDGRYKLFQTDAALTWFDKLNNASFDNREENMFMVQYAVNLVNNTFSIYFAPVSAAGKLTSAGIHFGGMVPTTTFFNSYAATDLRAQNRGFFFTEYEGIKFDRSVYKYFDKGLRTTAPNGNKSIPLLRYADVLLIYAEAQNAADGSPDADAYAAINAIRARSGLTALAGLSKDQFEQAVWRERAWELTCEGVTWFDMKRTGKVFNGTNFVNVVGYTLPTGKVIREENLYFLIPQSEIDVNPQLGN